MESKEENVQHFLDLIKKSRRGKFKIYIGMSAGVGKTYRMLQEAHALLRSGVNVKIGYVETHNRAETHALLEGLFIIPRRTLFYKGKKLEEFDLEAVISLGPEVVIIDELAHSNIEGSKNKKRWQDVLDVLEAGINVITAVNIQHIESLNEEVKRITGIEVTERVPDSVLALADEVVNIDLTANELITRLIEGKIYEHNKIDAALSNFFKSEHILQLRELALKEVTSQVVRQVESGIVSPKNNRREKVLACISSNEKSARNVIRKTARLAGYYNAKWYVLYVQTSKESFDRIPLNKQRYLINNFKLATELGAEIMRVENNQVAAAILQQCEERKITTVCIGKSKRVFLPFCITQHVLSSLLRNRTQSKIDVIILS